MKGKSILFGLIFLAVGGGLLAWGFNTMGKAKASMSWPTAKGKVLHSGVERKVSTSTSNTGSGRRRRTTTTYEADVRYEYRVDANRYSGNKVSFGEYSSSNRGHAERIVDRYPKGKSVEVFYNPDKPDTAVLEPGVSGGVYIPLGIGALFAVIGLGATIAAVVGKKSGGEASPPAAEAA